CPRRRHDQLRAGVRDRRRRVRDEDGRAGARCVSLHASCSPARRPGSWGGPGVGGGPVRDELLGREVRDLDIVYRDPRAAAIAYARRSGGSPFPLSERHGAWRAALDEAGTVDFTPLRGSIEDDLATRDFTLNAIAVALAGGEAVD